MDVFDRETQQYYWLDIKAHDMAAVPKRAMLFLCIEIEDVNDNPPMPDLPVFDVRLDEERPDGTYVGTIGATDADVNRNTGKNFIYEFHKIIVIFIRP